MKRLTRDQVIARSIAKHGDRYDYSKVDYINAQTKIIIICPDHGEFQQYSDWHMRGTGCKACAGWIDGNSGFIEKAKKIHGDLYQYSNIEYGNIKTKVQIGCQTHGFFWQVAEFHLQGMGCPRCIGRGMTYQEFKDDANRVHPNRYRYNEESFVNATTPVTITCQEHGDFKQTPRNHLRGFNCPVCADNFGTAKRTKTTSTFVEEAKKVHGETYDYSEVVYTGSHRKIVIKCSSHGAFEQTPASHLGGRGCNTCSHRISKGEQAWLDSLEIPGRQIHLKINGATRHVDGFASDTNTVYLYHGDYYHGNPIRFKSSAINPTVKKTYGELYQATLNLEEEIKVAGYNLVTMWEAEWTNWSGTKLAG